MSIPTLANNIIQPQNIVINQVPLGHAVMSNGTNSIPLATALAHNPSGVEQSSEMKTGIVMETIPMATDTLAGARLVGVHTVPVQNTSPVKSIQSQPAAGSSANSSDHIEILPKQRLMDLVRDTDANLTLEDEVEELILNYVDGFVYRVLKGACKIAIHRQGKTVEVKDVQQFLNRNYNMWVPGFGTDELKPYKRNFTAESHKARLNIIRKALKKY